MKPAKYLYGSALRIVGFKKFFITNKTRLVTKTALAEHVWGDHIDQADTFDFIYSQIKNLRKKLSDAKASVEIEAVYGVGYKLVVP